MTDNTANQNQPAQSLAQIAQAQPGPAVKMVDITTVFNQFHTRISALETAAKADKLKAELIFAKYWPIGVGILIAATRFI
jgi:hypothetical protein